MNNWATIRAFYSLHAQAIQNAPRNEWAFDPYAWQDAGINMTPIEMWLWSDMRAVDAVFYPQFPVAGVFVDFANPSAKVAIECDGKNFHDAETDAKRDAKLEATGWTVYRFTGRECMDDFDESTKTPSEAYRRIKQISENHKLRRSA